MRNLRLLRANRCSAPRGCRGRAARSRPGHAGVLGGPSSWDGLYSPGVVCGPVLTAPAPPLLSDPGVQAPSSPSLSPGGPGPQLTPLLRLDTTHISWGPPPPHAQALCSLRVRTELLIPEGPSAPTTCLASLSGTAHLGPFDPCLLLIWAPTCRPQLLPGSPEPSAARCGQCPALRAHASRGLPAAGPAPT